MQNPLLQEAAFLMEQWLGPLAAAHVADVYWFARRLTPEEVLEAIWIARRKLPEGGVRGFKYFCGVCWRKIELEKIRQALRSHD